MYGSRKRGPRTAGLILMFLGLALFGFQLLAGLTAAASTGALVMFVIASPFLLGYFRDHNYGLLIPGCILFGTGLAAMGDEISLLGGDFSAVGMGLGFLSIYVIDRIYSGRSHFWPLIPGGIMVAGGLSESGISAAVAAVLWPLLLVAAGLFFFMGGIANSRRERDPYRALEREAEARPDLPDPYARSLDDLPEPIGASDLDFGTAVGFDDEEDEEPRQMEAGS